MYICISRCSKRPKILGLQVTGEHPDMSSETQILLFYQEWYQYTLIIKSSLLLLVEANFKGKFCS